MQPDLARRDWEGREGQGRTGKTIWRLTGVDPVSIRISDISFLLCDPAHLGPCAPRIPSPNLSCCVHHPNHHPNIFIPPPPYSKITHTLTITTNYPLLENRLMLAHASLMQIHSASCCLTMLAHVILPGLVPLRFKRKENSPSPGKSYRFSRPLGSV